MRVYLVRHGKTQHNLENRHQTEYGNLLTESIQDISDLANRLKYFNIETIFASPFLRTKKTAQILNEVLNISIEEDSNLVEIKRPTEVEGKIKTEESVLKIKQLMHENRAEKSWHHSDEENFFDFKDRVYRFVKRLEVLENENVLVVTHSAVIKMFVALILFTNEMHVDTYVAFYNKVIISNGGLVTLEFKNGEWRLINWNLTS